MEGYTIPYASLLLRFSVFYNRYSAGLLSYQAYQARLFGRRVESAGRHSGWYNPCIPGTEDAFQMTLRCGVEQYVVYASRLTERNYGLGLHAFWNAFSLHDDSTNRTVGAR